MSVEQRSDARLAVVQALYQMEVAGKGLNDIFAEFETHWMGREIEGEQYKPAEVGFFRDILQGVLDDQVMIDREIDAALAGRLAAGADRDRDARHFARGRLRTA